MQINSLFGCLHTIKRSSIEAKQISTFTPVSSIWGSQAPCLLHLQNTNFSFLVRDDSFCLFFPANSGPLWTYPKVFLFKMIHTVSTIQSAKHPFAFAFHIPVWPRHQPFLSFAFQRLAYQFWILLFGILPSPRVFTRRVAFTHLCRAHPWKSFPI